MRKELVYFVAYDEPEYRILLPFVKIGKAKDLNSRLSHLQTSSPIKLGVAGFIRSENALQLEKVLHERYENDRIAGEWFKRSVCMVKSLRANYVIEADRFDEFVDVNEKCISDAPREYYEPKISKVSRKPVSFPPNKKLDEKQHKWNYGDLKSLKRR